MNLPTYFSTQCSSTSNLLKAQNLHIKKIVSGKKKEHTGVLATLSFDDFKIDISYYESGKSAYQQQTIWISLVLDSDPTLPFSIYDILAVLDPENFNCYTYSYVDSFNLMDECFDEINTLLTAIVPRLSEYLKNGTDKNRLIISQRESINKYFGDNVLEHGEMLGGAADNLIDMMLRNFHQAQIEAAVIGTQGLFYAGKDEKALKKLKKAKYLTQYQANLLNHLQKGGTSQNISETVRNASAEKGALRHGGGVTGAIKTIALALALSIPLSLALGGIFYVTCRILFRDALFVTGYLENILLMPPFCSILSFSLSLQIIKRKQEKPSKKKAIDIQSPKTPEFVNTLIKYVTIAGETLALIGCFTSVFSTTVFYKDKVGFSEEDFPLSHNYYDYSAIDYVAHINGFEENGKFYDSPYMVMKTKSGVVIDLYNSTCISANKVIKDAEVLKEKGIKIKRFDTFEDIE